LAENPQLRRRIASAAARQVRRRWLWPSLVARMRAVYEELVPRVFPGLGAIAQQTANLHALAVAP
jgi:hypothetical protein